jgi:hypothetical protein
MTHCSLTITTVDRRQNSPWAGLLMALAALLLALPAMAQAPAAPTGAAPPPAADAMDDLVGRIALYPDDLVAIILPASTSPLQIVQADRYLDKRKSDPNLPLDDKWDDAVKTLLNYPEVVKMMSNDLDWTSALGEAVVADQGAVLEGVQSFRRRAQAAGNLKSDDKQVVKAEKEIIIIEPANPEVIYVPQYTPSTVVTYGVAPIYGYYPAPYPSYYYPYPPGAALAAGVIWGAAIGAAWNGGHWGANYGGGDININRNTNINVDRGGGAAQRPAGGAAGSSAWKSGKQPGQVSSSIGKTPNSARAGDARTGAGAGGYGAGGAGGARASAQPGGGAVGGGTGRPSAQPSGGGSASRGGDAFSGYGSGRQTQMDSSRGASSRNSMSGGGARPTPSGGGARGGGARGGGGGGRGGRR